MDYVMQIVETEAQPVLMVQAVTSIGTIGDEIEKALCAVAGYAGEKGTRILGPAFVAYHNMDMEHLQVDIGFPVAHAVEGGGDVVAGIIPAGKKAVGYHKGSYQAIAGSYEALGKWIGEKGCVPTGVVYEYYFNSPPDVPENELLTKIEFLLA